MSAPLDLDAIAERVAAATPGPWVREPVGGGEEMCSRCAPYAHYYSIDAPSDPGWLSRVVTVRGYGDDHVLAIRIADAAFIAHARQDIPALIAEVRRLQAVVEAYEDAAIERGTYS